MDVLIRPSGQEEAITEEMLENYEEEETPPEEALARRPRSVDRSQSPQLRLAQMSANVSRMNETALDATRSGAEGVGADGDDEEDEITSDEDGDFEFLTEGLNDSEVYDLVRDLIAQCKTQEKEAAALEEECRALRDTQRTLRYGVAAEERKRRNRLTMVSRRGESVISSTRQPSSQSRQGASSTVPPAEEDDDMGRSVEIIDETVDEFDDLNLDSRRPFYRFMDPQNEDIQENPFRYTAPKVKGNFTSVFKSGFLFQAIVEEPRSDGAGMEDVWYFFNDSEKYSMHIKYSFSSTSSVQPGPKAVFTTLPSGETEVEVEVLPEETEMLVRGVFNGFRNLSVAMPISTSYRNHNVEMRNDMLVSQLDTFSKLLKVAHEKLTGTDVLSVCRRNPTSLSFIDPEFPPCSASIYRVGVDDTFVWNVPWRRPQEFLPADEAENVRLFRGSVMPEDPFPGDGGDVYLCSAASILAEFPMQVRYLFRHPKSIEEGKAERAVHAYRVTLNFGGWWRTILVDDFLPASSKGPDFGRCELDLRKIWYPILEKAYAKMYGSYAAIQCGDPIEALHDLTGLAANRFDEEWSLAREAHAQKRALESEKMFALIEKKLAKGYAVCVSLPDEGPENAKSQQWGMMYGMSYYVLRAVKEGGRRLLLLRCTTLSEQWDGNWNPRSKLWGSNPSIRKVCGDPTAMNNSLWMEWPEVLTMFEGVGVCYTRFDLHDYRVRGTFENGGAPTLVVEVQIKEKVSGFCQLSQNDDRGYDPRDESGWLTPLMLCISRSQGGVSNLHTVDKVCAIDPEEPSTTLNFILGRDVSLWYEFDPRKGPFYLIPRCKANCPGKPFTLSLLLDKAVDNDRVKVSFVYMAPDTAIFKNKVNFSFDPLPVQAEFQSRESGVVREEKAQCINF